MPWSVADVDSKKKGLTPSQKKKWVSIANGVLKNCQAKGGKDCEGKAIRVANSSFSSEVTMTKETQKVPESALHFIDHNCFAVVKQDGAEKPKLSMVAYSGGVIKDHWWWGNLAIDLNGMKFPKSKYPILESHDPSRKVGFTGKPVIEDNKLVVDSESAEFVDTPYAEEFIRLSKAGFPYESSIYAFPSAIERLEKGNSTEVNGFKLSGPATVWRQSTFKEVSVCVFGYDSNTRSGAFSKEVELEVDVQSIENPIVKEVKSDMITVDQFKAENEKGYNEFVESVKTQVKAEVQAEFDKEKTALEAKFAKEKEGLETQMSDRDKRILELEKKDAIRTENELRTFADRIWAAKLSESNIPEHLYEKVQKHVSYSQFVKDGVLDEQKFGEAIAAEVKDWESRGVTSKVLGTGFSMKGAAGDSAPVDDTKLVEDTTDRLLKLAGQVKK